MKTACTQKKFLDRLATVYLAIVPHNDQLPRNLMQEVTQEQGSLFALNIVLKELAVQGAMKPPWTDGDARDGGDTVVTIPMAQDWCLTDRAPCLPDSWDQ